MIRPTTLSTSAIIRQTALLAAMAIGAAAPVFAAPPSGGPEKRDCEAIERKDFSSKGDWINARIDCKHENVNAQLFTLVDQASESDGVFTETQKTHMKDARVRAEKARDRAKEAGGFKGLAKKDKVNCFVREFDEAGSPDNDGNNDGVCITRGPDRENCLEVIGDQIGDDDGICKGKEVCVQICDQASIDDDDDNFDDDAAADIEGALTDAELIMDETNKQVASRIQLAALAQPRITLSTVDTNNCLQLLGGSRRFDLNGLSGFVTLTNTLTALYNQCDSACNQDVLGNNGSIVCVVLATAAGISQIVSDAFVLEDADVTGMRFDASMACLQQMDVQLKDAQSKVGESNEKIDQLNGEVEELHSKVDKMSARLEDVIVLLNTPQGQRPTFPKP